VNNPETGNHIAHGTHSSVKKTGDDHCCRRALLCIGAPRSGHALGKALEAGVDNMKGVGVQEELGEGVSCAQNTTYYIIRCEFGTSNTV
jgi:hypothetical protein